MFFTNNRVTEPAGVYKTLAGVIGPTEYPDAAMKMKNASQLAVRYCMVRLQAERLFAEHLRRSNEMASCGGIFSCDTPEYRAWAENEAESRQVFSEWKAVVGF